MVVVRDIMKADVLRIAKEDSVFRASELMAEKNVSCLVVTEGDDAPQGIISRKDILEKVVVARKDIDSVKVEEVMSSPVMTVNEKATLIMASSLMKTKNIKQLPVVDQGKLTGMLTQTDLVASLGSIMMGEDGFSKEE